MCVAFSSHVHMFKGTRVWQVHIICSQGQKTTLGDVTQVLFIIIFETMSLPNLELSRYAGPADQQVSGMIGLSRILQGWDYRTVPPWVLECELRFFTDNHFPRTLPHHEYLSCLLQLAPLLVLAMSCTEKQQGAHLVIILKYND